MLDRMRRRRAALQIETDELNCHGVGRE
jgi:hypothetical protein